MFLYIGIYTKYSVGDDPSVRESRDKQKTSGVISTMGRHEAVTAERKACPWPLWRPGRKAPWGEAVTEELTGLMTRACDRRWFLCPGLHYDLSTES